MPSHYEKAYLFQLVKSVEYAMNEEDMKSKLKTLETDAVVTRNPLFADYANKRINDKQTCAIHLRKMPELRGQQTNNIAEAAMRVLKDSVLERLRAYNPVQLMDFLIDGFSIHYETKLLKIADGLPPSYLLKKQKKFSKYDAVDYSVSRLTKIY